MLRFLRRVLTETSGVVTEAVALLPGGQERRLRDNGERPFDHARPPDGDSILPGLELARIAVDEGFAAMVEPHDRRIGNMRGAYEEQA